MPRSLAWLLVAVLLGGFSAVAVVVLRERAALGKDMPAYSIFSESSTGLGESAHVLRQAGYRVIGLTRPVALTQHEGLLVSVQPPVAEAGAGEGMSPGAARGLLDWVARGNTLLLCTSVNTPIHHLLGVVVSTPAHDSDSFTAADLTASPYLEDVERLSVGREATLSRPPGGRSEVLWRVRGEAGALKIERGKGRVLLVADPGLLTRRGLVRDDGEPRDDNVMFLANVARLHARQGKVLFDEYDHGLRAGTGFWSYLAYHGRRWTLLPVLLVVGVVLWRSAVRLGPGVPRPRVVRADAVDFASALARLYQKAGTRRLLARILTRDFLGQLTSHLRLRRGTLPALILSAWKQHEPGPRTARLQELLRGVADLRKGEVNDRLLLHWARAFHDFAREIQPRKDEG